MESPSAKVSFLCVPSLLLFLVSLFTSPGGSLAFSFSSSWSSHSSLTRPCSTVGSMKKFVRPSRLTMHVESTPSGEPTLTHLRPYCEDLRVTKRRPTRTVWAGKVPIGSEHRIALQVSLKISSFFGLI